MKIVSISVLISAVLTIFFEHYNRQAVWLFKPLTMLLIIGLAFTYGAKKTFYARMILTGLIFSLVGDVFLIVPQTYFLYGLISFLIAHIFYTAAFIKIGKGKFNLFSLTAFVGGILVFLSVRQDVSQNLMIPVIIYAAAISTMLCFALNFYLTQKSPQAFYALSGAFLFVISDSILAINKFTYEFFFAKLLILSTYFAAQWLIARSCVSE